MNLKDVKLIYFSEFTVRFCIWSVLSGLLIHITHAQWVSMPKAFYMMGISLSLLYLCAILGGFVKDKFFNEKQAIIIGFILVGFANVALASSYTFFIGLGLLFTGAGMITPNTPLMLSHLLDNNKNDKAFTVFYAITNTGIVLGPIAGGLIEQFFSWKGMLALNEITVIVCLLFGLSRQWISSLMQIKKIDVLNFCFVLFFANMVIYLCFKCQNISKYILGISTLGYAAFLLWLMSSLKESRRSILFSVILSLFAIVFFCGEFQLASSLLTYADNFVSLQELYFNIPVSSFLSLHSVFVVIGAFVLTRTTLLSKIKFTQTKMLIGLMCCGIAFTVLYASTQIAGTHKISLLWIAVPSILLGIGEVCLMPPIILYIAKTSPEQFKGRLMSGMYFALSISGYLSGLIGESVIQQYHFSSQNISFYSYVFMTIICMLLIFSFLLVILRFSSMRSLGAFQAS